MARFFRLPVTALLVWVAVVCFSAAFAAEERWDSRELRPLPGYKGAVANAVNEERTVVGFSVRNRRGERETEATVWDASGKPRRLTWDGPFQLDGYQTEALDLNERGDIVGVGRRPNASEVLLFWPAGEAHAHWLEVSEQIVRAGLNGDGLVFAELERRESEGTEARVIRFDDRFSTAGVRLPGLAAGSATSAFDISADGSVVGASLTVDSRTHAVVWTPDPSASGGYAVRDLTPQAQQAVAKAIGPDRFAEILVAGAVREGEQVRAAAWEGAIPVDPGAPEGFEEAEPFGFDEAGYALCIVRSVDPRGQVTATGLWMVRPGTGDEFFIAAPADVRLEGAAIDPEGAIVVTGTGLDGRARSFVLTPPGVGGSGRGVVSDEEPN